MAPADFPRTDGSTATMPLASLVLQRTTGLDATDADGSMTFSGTSTAYQNLADGSVDLLLVFEPDPAARAQAGPKGAALDLTPVGRDALVFLTDTTNPVDALTSDQVRGIYTGDITSWKQVGGHDAPIVAYQRPEGSASQALMRALVMGGKTMMTPPTELVTGPTGELVDGVAAYTNAADALGYSVYYYVTNQYAVDTVNLLSIDGIAPSASTIADGTYPFLGTFYAVVRHDEPADSPARQVVAWLATAAGRQAIADAGYVATS